MFCPRLPTGRPLLSEASLSRPQDLHHEQGMSRSASLLLNRSKLQRAPPPPAHEA